MLVEIILIAAIIVLIVLLAKANKADAYVSVKSRQTLNKYDVIKFFKENKEKIAEAENIIKQKGGSKEGTYKIQSSVCISWRKKISNKKNCCPAKRYRQVKKRPLFAYG